MNEIDREIGLVLLRRLWQRDFPTLGGLLSIVRFFWFDSKLRPAFGEGIIRLPDGPS